MEAPVLRRRPVAKCSSLAAAGELASSSQPPPPPRLLLRLVSHQSAALRMIRWGCSVFAAVAAATMPLVRAVLGETRVSVTSRCPSGRSAAATRSIG